MSGPSAPAYDVVPGIDSTVLTVSLLRCRRIGELLSRYRSGPLPKPFKLLPSLPQWARLLALTSPADWTPHATFAATKIFVSNLKPKQATVFLRGILLERVRDDMSENGGKLNYQLYEALKKALYKPAAFFKGILFPLCDVSTPFILGHGLVGQPMSRHGCSRPLLGWRRCPLPALHDVSDSLYLSELHPVSGSGVADINLVYILSEPSSHTSLSLFFFLSRRFSR